MITPSPLAVRFRPQNSPYQRAWGVQVYLYVYKTKKVYGFRINIETCKAILVYTLFGSVRLENCWTWLPYEGGKNKLIALKLFGHLWNQYLIHSERITGCIKVIWNQLIYEYNWISLLSFSKIIGYTNVEKKNSFYVENLNICRSYAFDAVCTGSMPFD